MHTFFSPLSPALFFSAFFFFNDTATTEIYTLSLHDALPISLELDVDALCDGDGAWVAAVLEQDRKSTRLNSSHPSISYAVFCLKKTTDPYPIFTSKKKKNKNKTNKKKKKKK